MFNKASSINLNSILEDRAILTAQPEVYFLLSTNQMRILGRCKLDVGDGRLLGWWVKYAGLRLFTVVMFLDMKQGVERGRCVVLL